VRLRALFNSRKYDDLLAETSHAKLTIPRSSSRAPAPRGAPTSRSSSSPGCIKSRSNIQRATNSLRRKSCARKYYVTDEVKYDLAIADLEAAIARGASGNEGENIWTLGWTYFRAGRLDDAINTFARYAKQYPDGDYLSNSLSGPPRFTNAAANREAAMPHFTSSKPAIPTGYFSYRARAIIGEPMLAPNDIANGNVFPDVDAQLAAANEPRLDAVRELAWLGLYAKPRARLKSLAAANPSNSACSSCSPISTCREASLSPRTMCCSGSSASSSATAGRMCRIVFGRSSPAQLLGNDQDRSRAASDRSYLIASIIRQETGATDAVSTPTPSGHHADHARRGPPA